MWQIEKCFWYFYEWVTKQHFGFQGVAVLDVISCHQPDHVPSCAPGEGGHVCQQQCRVASPAQNGLPQDELAPRREISQGWPRDHSWGSYKAKILSGGTTGREGVLKWFAYRSVNLQHIPHANFHFRLSWNKRSWRGPTPGTGANNRGWRRFPHEERERERKRLKRLEQIRNGEGRWAQSQVKWGLIRQRKITCCSSLFANTAIRGLQ